MSFGELPEVIQRYLNAYEAMDVDLLLSCLSDDIMFINISNHTEQMDLRGKDRFREVASQSAKAFESRRQDVTDVIADKETGRYAITILFRGILGVDMDEDMKAGYELVLKGVSFMTVKDGLISQITDFS